MSPKVMLVVSCLALVAAKPSQPNQSALTADPGMSPIIKAWNYTEMNNIPRNAAMFANRLKEITWIMDLENAYRARYHQYRVLLRHVYHYEKHCPVLDCNEHRVSSGEEAWLMMELYPAIVAGRIVHEEQIETKLAMLEYVATWLRLCDKHYMRVEHQLGPVSLSGPRLSHEQAQLVSMQYNTASIMMDIWQDAGYEAKVAQLHEFAVMQFTSLPRVAFTKPLLAKMALGNKTNVASYYLAKNRNWSKPTYFWSLLGMELYLQEQCHNQTTTTNVHYMHKWMSDPRAAHTTGWFQHYLYFVLRKHYEAETGHSVDLIHWPLLAIDAQPKVPRCCFVASDQSVQCPE